MPVRAPFRAVRAATVSVGFYDRANCRRFRARFAPRSCAIQTGGKQSLECAMNGRLASAHQTAQFNSFLTFRPGDRVAHAGRKQPVGLEPLGRRSGHSRPHLGGRGLISGHSDVVVNVVAHDTQHLKNLARESFIKRPGVTGQSASRHPSSTSFGSGTNWPNCTIACVTNFLMPGAEQRSGCSPAGAVPEPL